jgi:hypothetical protein
VHELRGEKMLEKTIANQKRIKGIRELAIVFLFQKAAN